MAAIGYGGFSLWQTELQSISD